MKFSDRIGITKPALKLHLDDMPDELRTSFWNYFLEIYGGPRGSNHFDKVCKLIARDFAKFPIDELPNAMQNWDQQVWVKQHFYNLQWFQVYNLVEFLKNQHPQKTDRRNLISGIGYSLDHIYRHQVESSLNDLLERENSGYRFIDGFLAPITDHIEIEEVSMAMINLQDHNLIDVRRHLEKAIELFSLKPEADYKNSIKESVSAVETLLKQKVTENGRGIKGALSILKEKLKIHSALCDSVDKMYAFSSDESGIRHGTWGADNDTGFFEAKYMLVMSTAFINYLIGKEIIK